MDGARRRRLGAIAAALAIVVVGVAAWAVIHRLGPKHWVAVSPGVLYRSGQLTPEQLGDAIERYGIRTVVNLRSENENGQGDWHRREREVAAGLGARHLDLPMNSGFPPRDEVLAAWLDVIADQDARPVLVHCEYGVVRTGVMVALWEIEQRGRTAAEALARFEPFGHTLRPEIRTRIDDYFAAYVPRAAAD